MLAEGISVASTNVPVRTTTPLAVSCAVMAANSVRSSPRCTSSARKRTKAVRSGVGSFTAKPQNRRKLARSVNASSSFTSDRSCQTANNMPLKRLRGGQPASPRGELEISSNWGSISVQSLRPDIWSNDDLRLARPPSMASCSCPIRRRAIHASNNADCSESSYLASPQALSRTGLLIPCVDGPWGSRRFDTGRLGVACVHVSGLSVRLHDRWPRWLPQASAKQDCGLMWPQVLTACLACRCDRWSSCAGPKPPASTRSSGGDRLAPIHLATRHHRPHDAGDLVGQRHSSQLSRLACEQRQQPSGDRRLACLGMTDHGHGADHEQAAQSFVASLADPAEALLAAG